MACPGLTMLQAEIERGSTYEGKRIFKNSLKKYQQDILMGFLSKDKEKKGWEVSQKQVIMAVILMECLLCASY